MARLEIIGSIIFLLSVTYAQEEYYTCSTLQKQNVTSGLQHIFLPSGVHQVYCEMGINGGGYTFLPFEVLHKLDSKDLKHLFKRRGDALLRISKPDGTQPYTIIQQKVITGGLKVLVNDASAPTLNKHVGPFIYLETSPRNNNLRGKVQGFKSNGATISFKNCDGNPNSYFAFYSNPKEMTLSKHRPGGKTYEQKGAAIEWRQTAKRPISGRRMPLNYFLLTEVHHGGCGTYTSSDRWMQSVEPALGAAIGLR